MTGLFRNHHVSRRQVLGGLGAAGALLVLSACAGESTQPVTVGGKPVVGGTLTVGMGGGASTETLDPFNAVTSISIARVAQINETLLRYDNDFQIVPHLAESVVGNDTATEWTITLRDDVHFHNGDPLEAEDVLFTLAAILNPDSPGAAARVLAQLNLDDVVIVDSHTLILPFSAPFSTLPDALAMAASSAVRVIPRGFDVNTPVGTGPFIYESFTPGQYSKFVRNDDYWVTDKPYLDAIEITNMNDDSARVNALVSGQVGAIASVPASSMAVIEAQSDLKLLVSESGAFNPIVMRTDIAPFNDVRVRQAFRLIADRDQLITSVVNGNATVANDLYAPFDAGFNKALQQREQDIDAAKKLLADAGQAGMSIEMVTSNISEGVVAAAQVFAQQAEKAGVTISVLEVQPTDFWSKHFLKAPLTQSDWATRSYLMQALDSMMPESPYNETGWTNDEWQALIDEALATVDEGKRNELISQAQEIEWDEGGYIIWGYKSGVDAHSSKLQGLEPDKSGIYLNTFRFGDAWLTE